MEHMKKMRDPKWIEYLSTPNVCEICGKALPKSEYNNAYLCSSECFNVHFWNEKLEDYNSKEDLVVVIEGTMYSIRNYSKKWLNGELLSEQKLGERLFVGYCGDKFKIQRNDGVLFEIDDLWCNGDISYHIIDKMPDNAKFIR